MKIRCRPLAIKNSAHLLQLLLKSFETFAQDIMSVQKVTHRISTYPQELEKHSFKSILPTANFVCLIVAILMII